MSSYHSLPRPQRKDAVRNRAALIQAAREVFAQRGFEASMDDIAEHARLGVGTAYRHFPNKYVLADAVFDDVVREFVALARQTLLEPDPWDALVGLIERLLEAQTDNRAIREIMLGQRQDSPDHHRAMIAAFTEPFARARGGRRRTRGCRGHRPQRDRDHAVHDCRRERCPQPAPVASLPADPLAGDASGRCTDAGAAAAAGPAQLRRPVSLTGTRSRRTPSSSLRTRRRACRRG